MVRRRSGCTWGDNCCRPRPLGNLDFHLPLGRHITREAMVDKRYRKGEVQQWLSMRKCDGSSSSYSSKDRKKDRNVETIWIETRCRLTKSGNNLGLIYSWCSHALPMHTSSTLPIFIEHSFSVCCTSRVLVVALRWVWQCSRLFGGRLASFINILHDSRCILDGFLAFPLCIWIAFPLISNDAVVLPYHPLWTPGWHEIDNIVCQFTQNENFTSIQYHSTKFVIQFLNVWPRHKGFSISSSLESEGMKYIFSHIW